MYIAGFVIPVPEEKMEAYRKWAEEQGRQYLGNMDASRSTGPGRITSPVANLPTSAAP